VTFDALTTRGLALLPDAEPVGASS
jgi:hypothetical protein